MRRGREGLACVLAAAAGASAVAPAPAGAFTDDFTPVRFAITVAQTARRGVALPITVAVTANPDALAGSSAMWLQVKLAPECGGSYQTTTGTVLIDRPLRPQPATGQAYSGTLSGSGRPTAYGVQTVCVFLDQSSDHRQYATSQEFSVNVSQPCTTAAAAFDHAAQALTRAQRRRTGVAAARTRARRLKRAAAAACGTGVAL